MLFLIIPNNSLSLSVAPKKHIPSELRPKSNREYFFVSTVECSGNRVIRPFYTSDNDLKDSDKATHTLLAV